MNEIKNTAAEVPVADDGSLAALSAALKKEVDRLIAAQAAPSVPEGWAVVPKEPTDEMKENIAAFVDMVSEDTASVIYRAMIAAAPAAQAPERPTMDERGYIAACNLAKAIHARYYREDAPDFQVWPDTLGVITQIDNMVSGLTRRAAQAPSDAKDAQRYRALRWLGTSGIDTKEVLGPVLKQVFPIDEEGNPNAEDIDAVADGVVAAMQENGNTGETK